MRVLLLAGVLAAALVSPAQAEAAPGTVSCTGGEIDLLMHPGLTLAPGSQWLTLTGTLGRCVTPDHPAISSGVLTAQGGLTAGCPGPIAPDDLEMTVRWSDGSVSTVEGARFQGDIHQWALMPGTITSGPFTGGRVAALGRSTGLPDPWVLPCVIGGLSQVRTAVQAFGIG